MPGLQGDIRTQQWAELLARADVVIESIVSPAVKNLPVGSPCNASKVHAVFTDLGLAQQSKQKKILCEFELQAFTGAMAVTGHAGQAPQMIATPILELLTGINGATSIIAALRAKATETAVLDLAIYDSAVAFLGTFHSTALADPARQYRDGCRHPLIAPWNSYPTADGRIVLCSTTDVHWLRIATLIDRPEAIVDPRFSTTAARARNAAAVDAFIEPWTRARSTQSVLEALEKIAIPSGMIASIEDMLQEERRYQHVREVRRDDNSVIQCPIHLVDFASSAQYPIESVDLLRRTEGQVEFVDLSQPTINKPSNVLKPTSELTGALDKPLSGIRVIEIGPYTAGPYAGRLLADLGADVVKVEPLGGEVSRKWLPSFSGLSGYFQNYNAGKKSLFLDFQKPDDGQRLWQLLATADVLIQNLGPGALARAGFGPEAVLPQRPDLIYCSISGFGASAKVRPAVDTVVQAASGVMALVGNDAATREQRALKIGLSIADLIAAHVCALSVVARLGVHGAAAQGGSVDISMLRSLAWMTQLAWSQPNDDLPKGVTLKCSDGYVFSLEWHKLQSRSFNVTTSLISVGAMLQQFSAAGISGVEVREPYAVLTASLTSERHLLQWVQELDMRVPILTTPHRWSNIVPGVHSCVVALA
jgi:crotonobetainyl-CoA:carnitine CoA-transferase CaiB-like acyl-CoA transferase